MHFFFVNNKTGNIFLIKKHSKNYHHIKNVLHISERKNIICIYEKQKYLCTIKYLQDEIRCQIVKKLSKNKPINFSFALLFPFLKQKKHELLMQKATELGVNYLMPVMFERSVVQMQNLEKKQSRYQQIILQAGQQSTNVNLPLIKNAYKIKELGLLKEDFNIFAYEKADLKKNFNQTMLDFKNDKNINILIGPEGGITEAEFNLLKEYNFHDISLGENILRSDTAGIYLMSLVKNYLQNYTT